MPELPEVETTKSGISPFIIDQKIKNVIIRNAHLRWPIPSFLPDHLHDLTVRNVSRRAKYILITFETGHLICHLGMSGHLKIIQAPTPILKHDHVDFIFHHGVTLRYNDPRRFGSILWTSEPISEHFLIKNLGPEPLSTDFNATHLQKNCQKKQIPIKSLIMNQKIVVGVGNIYASEALYLASIHPLKSASDVTYHEAAVLVVAIQKVLQQAIAKGGTTISDYINSDGKPGYFNQSLQVYQREHLPCFHCGNPIVKTIVNQRGTFFCPICQH